jgi:hypothetical protein
VLFSGTVPENKVLFSGTVPENKVLFSGTVQKVSDLETNMTVAFGMKK